MVAVQILERLFNSSLAVCEVGEPRASVRAVVQRTLAKVLDGKLRVLLRSNSGSYTVLDPVFMPMLDVSRDSGAAA